ncbi:MAG UNVERIFIED_CONTAM: hypothetical protein LVR18_21180 [Planctomycetaceae bacterium]|jgi:hypothetical protein
MPLTAVRSDPRLAYRLAIRKPQPDFRIAAIPAQSSSGLLLRRGGREAIRLIVWRQDDFEGEIRVTATGLPEGVAAEESIIGPGNNFGILVLTAADGAKGSSDMTLTAKAALNGGEIQREVRIGASSQPTQPTQPGNNIPSVRARLVAGIRVSVSEFETAPQTISIGTPGQVIETARGGVVKIPWEVRRTDGTAGNITGFPLNVPPGTTAQQVNIGGNPKGEFELRFTSTSVPGTYSVHMAGFNQGLQYKRYPELVDRAKERQARVAKVLMDAQQKVQMLTQENQKLQTELTAATTAQTAANTAKQQADQKATAAATALQQAETALKQKQDQSAANPADEGLKKQAADALTARENAKKQTMTAKRLPPNPQKNSNWPPKNAPLQKPPAPKPKQTSPLLNSSSNPPSRKKHGQINSSIKDNRKPIPEHSTWNCTPTPCSSNSPNTHSLSKGMPANTTVAQGAKSEVVVKLGRKFDFKGAVTVQTTLPPGVAGLQIPNASVPENQGEAKFEITAAPNATVGDHPAKIRLQINYNGQTIVAEHPFGIRVTEVKPPPQ